MEDSNVLELTPIIKTSAGILTLGSFKCKLASLDKNTSKETILMDSSEHLFTVEYFYSRLSSNFQTDQHGNQKPKNLTIKSIIKKFSLDSPTLTAKKSSLNTFESPLKRKSSLKIKLKSMNKPESESNRKTVELTSRLVNPVDFRENPDYQKTLCTTFFVAGLNKGSNELIDCSEGLNSYCFHDNFCSKMKAYKPSVIQVFPDKSLSLFPVADNLLNLAFPCGVKICYNNKNERQLVSTFSQLITTELGEKYTLVVFPIFISYPRDRVIKEFNIDPCKSLINFEQSAEDDPQLAAKLEFVEQVSYLDNWLLPYAFVFLTKLDISRAESVLEAVVKMAVNNYPAEEVTRLICHLTLEATFPIESSYKLFIPFLPNGLEISINLSQDCNIKPLFEYLSSSTIINVLNLLLTDQKVIFVGEEYSQITAIIDGFLFLLYPFEWPFTVIKCISLNMADLLSSIHPFIVGIELSVFTRLKSSLSKEDLMFLVDVKANKIKNSLTNKSLSKKEISAIVPLFPKEQVKLLEEELSEVTAYFEKNDYNQKRSLINKTVRRIFGKFYSMVLVNYFDFITVIDNKAIFDSKNYLEHRSKEEIKFLDEFVTTQIFLGLINENLAERKNFLKKTLYRYKSASSQKLPKTGIMSVFKTEKSSSFYLSFNKVVSNSTNNTSSYDSNENAIDGPILTGYFSEFIIPVEELIAERYKETFPLEDTKIFDCSDLNLFNLLVNKEYKEITQFYIPQVEQKLCKRGSMEVIRQMSTFSKMPKMHEDELKWFFKKR